MSRLFVQLYLDEDVSVLVAELLRVRGFDAVTTQKAGRLGRADAEQLEHAISQSRTLLTHNRADFESLAQRCFSSGQKHFGIIIATRHSAHEIVRRLLIILNQTTADEMIDQLIYI